MIKSEFEPYKELIDGLLQEIDSAMGLFDKEYDDRASMKDLRWQSHMEGVFVDQLARLASKRSQDLPSEAIGEYVVAFFNAQDAGDFDI